MKKLPNFDDHLAEIVKNPAAKDSFDAWDLPIRLSNALAQRREDLGLTQRQLAQKLQIPQQVVSKVENLTGGTPKLLTLQRVATALGLRLDFSLQEHEPNEIASNPFKTQGIELARKTGWLYFKVKSKVETSARKKYKAVSSSGALQ